MPKISAQCVFLRFPGGLERVKTELREEASGHSSVSDVESDSDSHSEVNDCYITLCERKEKHS